MMTVTYSTYGNVTVDSKCQLNYCVTLTEDPLCCNFFWGKCGKTLSDRLQKLQNRAACVFTSLGYDADANSLTHQLGWKDLCTQCQIQKALMVHKSLNGLVPKYLSSKFVKRDGTRYSLRGSENKRSPRGISPGAFLLPSGCKIHYGHSRYEPKWCKLLKLVIYRTFDMFAVIPPPRYVFTAPFSL